MKKVMIFALVAFVLCLPYNIFAAGPADPIGFGFPENEDQVGIRSQSRGIEKYYAYGIPVEIKGLAEKSVEIHINITPEFKVENVILELGLVDKGWLMVSEIKPGNVHILAAGPRQIGDPHAISNIVYLFGKGTGKYQATINACIDGQWCYGTSIFEYHMKGDINGDLVVNSADAMIILKYLLSQHTDAGETLTPLEISIGDVNYNHALDVDDAVGILKYSVGLIASIDQLCNCGAPSSKMSKNFSIIVKELAVKGVDPAVIALLNQLIPLAATNKLVRTWGKLKS